MVRWEVIFESGEVVKVSTKTQAAVLNLNLCGKTKIGARW